MKRTNLSRWLASPFGGRGVGGEGGAVSLALGIALLTCVAGCSSARHEQVSSAVQPPFRPASQTSGTVNVWAWNIAAKALQKLEPKFEEKHPKIDVRVDMTGARMPARLLLSLASGVGAPDVSQFECHDAPRYIETGRLADLTAVAAKYRDRFPDNLWRNCVKDGKVYAVPWDMGPCAVFYKRNIFRKCGIDPEKIETWDDFIEAGKTIAAKTGGRTKMLTLGWNVLRPMFELLMQQAGGQVFDDEGRVAVNSRECAEALDVLRKMRQAGICSDVQLWSQEVMASFNSETIATYPMAVWFAGSIKDTVKDFSGEKQEWGVFRLPAIRPGGLRVSNLGGSVLAIPAECRNKEAAWRFVEYALCTVEGQVDQYRSMSLFPAYLPALSDPVMAEADPFFGGQKVAELFARDVTKIRPLNRTAGWSETQRYLEQALSQWVAKGMPEGLLATLELKIARRLGLQISPESLSRVAAR